jgi:beta-glucosidase-like glycosyl hydrolase
MQSKAANLIITRLDIDKFIEEELYQEYIFQLVKNDVGGFCVFNGTIENTLQTIEKLNNYSKNSLIYLADFEYGTAMRISDGISYPHNMALGKYNDTDVTYNISKQIAKEMKEFLNDQEFETIVLK